MIFTVDQVRSIRQGTVTAALVSRHEKLKPGVVRPLRRRFIRHDENGDPLDTVTETVTDPIPHTAERVPVILTILDVRDLELPELTLLEAKACGYRTVTGLIGSWRAQHPRVDLIRFARFALGDLRDRHRFLSAIPFHTDYTSSAHEAAPGEPEALSEQDTAIFAAINGQRYARQRADIANRLAMRGMAQRLAAIEAAAAAGTIDARPELRIIEQRLARAERRLSSEILIDE